MTPIESTAGGDPAAAVKTVLMTPADLRPDTEDAVYMRFTRFSRELAELLVAAAAARVDLDLIVGELLDGVHAVRTAAVLRPIDYDCFVRVAGE